MKFFTKTAAGAAFLVALGAVPGTAMAHTTYPEWYMIETVGDSTCLQSAGYNADVIDHVGCDQSQQWQYFQYGVGTIHDFSNNCLTDNGQTLTTIESCNGQSNQAWTENWNLTIQNQAYSDCLDGFTYPECWWNPQTGWQCVYLPFAYTNTCSSNDNYEQFSLGSAGSNQLHYVTHTLHAYGQIGKTYVMDVYGNGRANGTKVDIAPYNGTTAQIWSWDPYTSEIHLTNSNNMCLDKPGGQNGDGTQLQIWTCNGGTNQQWSPGFQYETLVAGNYALAVQNWINVQSGTCLDSPLDNFSNPYLQVWHCNGGLNQDWGGSP